LTKIKIWRIKNEKSLDSIRWRYRYGLRLPWRDLRSCDFPLNERLILLHCKGCHNWFYSISRFPFCNDCIDTFGKPLGRKLLKKKPHIPTDKDELIEAMKAANDSDPRDHN